MTHLFFAAQTGWGKSYYAQAWQERNIPNYDHGVTLDFKREYKGLVKAGFAKYWIAGPRELSWSVDKWQALIATNPHVVLGRHPTTGADQWQAICARVIAACRRLDGSALVAVDEAHFVAPQRGSVPDVITGLATTGRGEGVSSIWITQRPAKIDEDFISQCTARLLGGFSSNSDLDKVGGIIDYPQKVHNPGAQHLGTLPEELLVDSESLPLRRFTNSEGDTIGSEWIYSDDTGTIERRDTRHVGMQSTHYSVGH